MKANLPVKPRLAGACMCRKRHKVPSVFRLPKGGFHALHGLADVAITLLNEAEIYGRASIKHRLLYAIARMRLLFTQHDVRKNNAESK